ncbi:MAG TPA: hypothetical protein VMQ86_06765 [Bryobacteraceae bacterium]|nr:hypothetical protein [Bryobacteraceae bacterium]
MRMGVLAKLDARIARVRALLENLENARRAVPAEARLEGQHLWDRARSHAGAAGAAGSWELVTI